MVVRMLGENSKLFLLVSSMLAKRPLRLRYAVLSYIMLWMVKEFKSWNAEFSCPMDMVQTVEKQGGTGGSVPQ